MTDIHDCIELVLRLEQLRAAPPASLHLTRQRDGPREGKHPHHGVSPRYGVLRGPQMQHAAGVDYRSRRIKP